MKKILDIIPVPLTPQLENSTKDAYKIAKELSDKTNNLFGMDIISINKGSTSIEDAYDEAINSPYILEKIKERTIKLADLLTKAEKAIIKTDLGTNLLLNIKDRKGLADTGIFHNKGDFGNLPAGEAYIPPLEGFGDGDLVIDGAMAGIGVLNTPIKLKFKNGKIINIEGGFEAEQLRKILENSDENAWKIAELGIGTNDEAYLMGNVLVDEKVYGTVHVAIGDNSHMEGKQKSSIYLDGIIKKPTLILDNEKIIDNGNYKL